MPVPTGDTLLGCRSIVFRLPDDSVFTRAVIGQLSSLGYPDFWEALGLVSPQDAASYFDEIVRTLTVYQCGEEPVMLPDYFEGRYTNDGPVGALASAVDTYYDLDWPDIDAPGTHFSLDGPGVVFSLSPGKFYFDVEAWAYPGVQHQIELWNSGETELLCRGVPASQGNARIHGVFINDTPFTYAVKFRHFFYHANASGRRTATSVIATWRRALIQFFEG